MMLKWMRAFEGVFTNVGVDSHRPMCDGEKVTKAVQLEQGSSFQLFNWFAEKIQMDLIVYDTVDQEIA